MERISSVYIRKIMGFSLIFGLIFLYSDMINRYQADQEVNDTTNRLSDQSMFYISKALNYFEMNVGQANDQVRFLSRGKNHILMLTPDGALLNLKGSAENAKPSNHNKEKRVPACAFVNLSIGLTGSNPNPFIEGIHILRGRSNYLIGNDPEKWHKNVPHYEMVKYSNVYNGIDLIYHNRKNNLEYDFIVTPGADPQQIGITVKGAEKIKIDVSGNLLVHTRLGKVMIKAPVTYQEADGKKCFIASDYRIDKNHNISILIGTYDKSIPLIIDPEILYSTYLGGNNDDGGYGIDVDDEGNVYVTGYTQSADFPGVDNGSSLSGETDVFVTKINALTSELIFTTILGGSSFDYGLHLGIDDGKDISIAGWTCSDNFPVKNAIQNDLGDIWGGNTENGDVFALKLDHEGSSLIYSTYLGGREEETLFDAVFDNDGNAYLSGYTKRYLDESDWTCKNSFPLYPKKFEDYPNRCSSKHFVLKINSNGTLQYSVLSELKLNVGNRLAVNTSGNACLLKWSDLTYEGGGCYAIQYSLLKFNNSGTLVDSLGFIINYNSTLSFPIYATDLLFDNAENIYITGRVDASIIPVTPGACQPTFSNNNDAFILKLNKDASGYLYATYLGGSGNEYPQQIYLDNKGCIYVYGYTYSDDFPVKNAIQSTFGGECDAFLTLIDPSKSGAASLLFSTYVGGNKTDFGNNFAFDAYGRVYLTGLTYSTDFPVENALISSLTGNFSSFITILSLTDTINLIYDKVVISGPPVFWPLRQPNTQQVLPQFLINKEHDTILFRFEGRSTDSRVGLRVTNTMVNIEPPLILDMAVFDPDNMEIATFTIHNMGEGNRGVQFDVTKNGYYTVKVWAEPNSGPFPAPFQIHLAGNVGWPRPLLYPIPNTPPNGIPDTIRATRQDILINATAPRPQLLRGRQNDVLFLAETEVSQTSLFKFTNIFQVSGHAIAVLMPFNKMGFEPGRAPVRMVDPNPMIDITTPTAPFNNQVPFPGGGYVVDFTQVPIPASVLMPVQLRYGAVLGKADGIFASLPAIIPSINEPPVTYTFILDMGSGQEVVDGDGNDFIVYSPGGSYRVAVSNTVFKDTFIPIGEVFSGDQEFDLNGTGLKTVRFIRIIAEPAVDIDAVKALNYFCDEMRTDIGPISKVSYVTLTARRSKAPQTLLDPFIELIGPDGALNASDESSFGDDLSQNCSDAALINMELNQEGFYRYLGRGHDKTPNEESFGFFYTRYESAGSYDTDEIIVSESELADISAQRTVTITEKRQRDSYLFQAAPNQIINIAVYSSEIDVMVELYDPEEFLIAACDNYPGLGTNAFVSVQLPDSSFVGQAPLPDLNTYRVVVSAIDYPGSLKSTSQTGNPYIRDAAVGEYSMKVTTSDELLNMTGIEFEDYHLIANYPNPFDRQTTIKYHLSTPGHVVLKICSPIGQELVTLINAFQPEGEHEVIWLPEGLPAGPYFYKLVVTDVSSVVGQGRVETGKMMLVK